MHDTIFNFVYLFSLKSKEICRGTREIINKTNNLEKRKCMNFLLSCSIETPHAYYYCANLNLVWEYREAVHQLLFNA